MRLIAALLLFALAACTVTGKSGLQVRVIDQHSHRPIACASMVAEYVTVWPAPMANPRRIERASDAYGRVQFDKLADGAWTIRVPSRTGQVQEAYFSIYKGHMSCGPKPGPPPWAATGAEVTTIEDGRCIGVVAGDPCATPTSPVIFYGSLAQ